MDLATLLQSLLNQQMPSAPVRGEAPMRQQMPMMQQAPMQQPAPAMMPRQQAPQMPDQAMPAQMPQQVAPRAPQQPVQPQARPQSGIGNAIGDFVGELFNPGQRARNKTVEWLQQNGLDEGSATLVAGNRDLLNRFMVSRIDPDAALDTELKRIQIDQARKNLAAAPGKK